MSAGFLLSAAMTVVLTRQFGASGYAVATLLASLLLAFPFADIGLGAGVVNATADYLAQRLSRTEYLAVLRATVRILWFVALLVALCTIGVIGTGAWVGLLGSLSSQPGAALGLAATLLSLAVSVPIGLGPRILQGAGRTRQWTLLSFCGTGVQAVALLFCIMLRVPAALYVLGPAAGVLANAIVATYAGVRVAGLPPSVWWITRQRGSFPAGYRPRSSAVPTVLTMVGIAASLQIDRLILSHVSDSDAVAEYSYVGQFAAALVSVLTLMSLNLWPRYRQSVLDRDIDQRGLWRDVRLFACIGLAAAVALPVPSLLLASVLVGTSFPVHLSTVVWAALYVWAWALVRPGTMLLSDPVGMWMQAGWMLPQTVCNVMLTVVLGHAFGAAGAFCASALAILVLQAVPLTFTAIRLYTPRRA